MENISSVIENKENEFKNENDSKNNGTDEEKLNKTDIVVKKEKDFSLSRKVSFIRESVSDSGVPERRLSSTAAAEGKRSSLHSQEADSLQQGGESPKIPRKFISTWRHACDRTKDRTKELLKRWRTLPEGNTDMLPPNTPPVEPPASDNPHKWSVHVWASYIKRYPSEDEDLMMMQGETAAASNSLSSVQKEKLGHFFSYLLDNDHDDLISEQDFEHFSEIFAQRLRRFADWSTNSPEFLIMIQVQHGFLSTFMADHSSSKDDEIGKTEKWKQYTSLEEWLHCWANLVTRARGFQDFPVWLQYLPKLFFQAINQTESQTISRDELGSFYSSMLGFNTQRVGEILDEAYSALTSNGDHPISYNVYRLAFTNFLLGRHPNGPGQYLFGCVAKKLGYFPIDYSALNSTPEEREHYTPDKKSNRVSVVV